MHEFYYTAVYWSYVLVLVSGHQESEIRPRVQGPDKNYTDYTRGRTKLQREMTRPRPHQCRCQCQLKHIDLMDWSI